MAKRSNEGEILERIKQIGRIIFNRNEILGKGSFGRVFIGTYKEPGKPEIAVAIKRIELLDAKDIEIKVLKDLKSHVNVLQYYCDERDNNFTYIATKLCAGTLDDIIKGTYTGPPVGSRREMMRQIARGVKHLHKNQIVHRDIKPVNILVSFPDPEPQMKLADFGLSRVLKSDGSEKSLTQCGSPGWKAPELQRSASAKVNDRKDMFAVDIFSLGCVFAYSLSTGNQHPFGPENLRDYRIENEDMILTLADFDQYGPSLFYLICDMLLKLAPSRLTIREIIQHPFFTEGINSEHHGSITNVSKDYETIIYNLRQLEMEKVCYDVNRKDRYGRTLLMQMLCCKNVDIGNGNLMHDYISKFFNLPNVGNELVNTKDKNSNTALTLLCEHYNGDDLINIIRLLIAKGTNLNQITARNGFNALMLLCMHYNHDNLIDIVRLFIENGLDVNSTSVGGWNVLHIICRYYNSNKLFDIIALLIENGIDLNATTRKEGWNVIAFLCMYYSGTQMFNIFRLLLEKKINLQTKSNRSALNALGFVCCFYSGDDLIGIIKMLIENDPAIVDCISKKNNANPLLMLCWQEYTKRGPDNLIDIIRLLIDQGVDVNNKLRDGWNALMFLCRYYRHKNFIDIVELLVHHRIDINCKTENGLNALILLCTNGNVDQTIFFEIFKLLIDLKIDVNVVYKVDSNNVLTTLCKNHHNCDRLSDIIRLILDHSSCSIDVNHKNSKGEDARSILHNKGGKLRIKDWDTIMELLNDKKVTKCSH